MSRRRRARRYRARPPRGVRWLRFRHRVRRVLTLGRSRRRSGRSQEPDELLLEQVQPEGQLVIASARARADAIVAEAEERALGAERLTREYLEAIDALIGGSGPAAASNGASHSNGNGESSAVVVVEEGSMFRAEALRPAEERHRFAG